MTFTSHLSESDMTALEEIRELVRTQDNACTADPIFTVQRLRRQYGVDPDFANGVAWLDCDGDCEEAGYRDWVSLEAEYQATGNERDGWSRTGYVDTWETVQSFFTHMAAQAFILSNSYNLGKCRIYVESAHRNHEMRLIRRLLLGGAS